MMAGPKRSPVPLIVAGDKDLLKNSGEAPTALFKTGGALDVMIAVDPKSDPKRTHPIAGDQRLLVTQVAGKTRAMLYQAVVPGTKEPVPFSSPWRTITLDRVTDVSGKRKPYKQRCIPVTDEDTRRLLPPWFRTCVVTLDP